MSPKAADPNVRTALVETAARLLTEEGPSALTTRRLAREVGTSTMAVYTHFGGMEELLTAISLEGFRRLARRLNRVKPTEDPVADVVALGRAYGRNALANPGSLPGDVRDPARRLGHQTPADQAMTLGTFTTLVAAVQRCIDAQRIDGDAWAIASQMWATLHGVVMLELSGFLGRTEAVRTSEAITFNLVVGLGDDPALARRSIGGTLATGSRPDSLFVRNTK